MSGEATKQQASVAFHDQCDIMWKGRLHGKLHLEVVFKDGHVESWKLQQEIVRYGKGRAQEAGSQ